ncbi:synaptic vesicle glycoprotein 2C-like [Uranotaenia lowii]|uniref:synaptic vesicle glycoprotein 2C-like n=1 Tax=Uranotaenia lowii TaxID=190385 RepID=UPI00247A883D|nr:synaptic vesicle glycoprotein 2C-like [Uranotaenia lowii]
MDEPEVVQLSPLLESKEKRQVHSFDEALSEAGFGRAQIVLTVLCGFAVMASANESMGMGIILPASQCDLDLDMTRKGFVGGAVFFGIMVSTYYWGRQTDLRGRHTVLRTTLVAASLFSLAGSFVNNFYLLVVIRFMVGLFMSAPSSTAIVYLGEFCPAHRRSQMIIYLMAIATSGFAYVAVIAWWILSYEWTINVTETFIIRPWRLLFVLNSLPGLIATLILFSYPESPKFLLSQGKPEEALEVLRWIYRKNKRTKDPFPVHELKVESRPYPSKEENQGDKPGYFSSLYQQVAPIFEKPNGFYLLIASVQTFTAYITYGGLGMWFPQIMNLLFSAESKSGDKFCSLISQNSVKQNPPVYNSTGPPECVDVLHSETFVYTLLLGSICSTVVILNSIILGYFTDRTMLYFNMLIAGCAGIALQYIAQSYIVGVMFCVEIITGAISVVLIRSLQVSIFPTHIRATAIALTTLVGRVGQATANVVAGVLLVQYCTATLYFIVVLLFCSAALNVLYHRLGNK